MRNWRGAVLFGLQVICIAYILLTGFWLASPGWVWLEILGAVLGAWAVATMKPRHVSPFPKPSRDTRLVTRGPYRWIRHPMYSAVLVVTLTLAIDRPTPARWVVWFVLLGDLLLKLQYEELLLARRFPEYRAYQQRTKRLLPFVY